MRARRRRDIAGLAVAGVLIAAGGALLIGTLSAPQTVEHAYGTVKTSITGTVDEVREETFGVLPTVRLGATGGVPALDACDGSFTEMASYKREGVPPVWAAHNNCLGDVLLPWETGQHIRLEGSGQVYEVIDIRHTGKTWATTEDLIGLGGSLALQTCFYGEDSMKFVGLEPVG